MSLASLLPPFSSLRDEAKARESVFYYAVALVLVVGCPKCSGIVVPESMT